MPRGGPDLDRPDVQYGDRQAAEQAQRAVPIQRQPRPQVAPRAGTPLSRRGPQLPDFMFEQTSRPDEPVTAGLDMGAGPGSEALSTPPQPDMRVQILEYLASRYNNQDALRMRNEIVTGKKNVQQPAMLPEAPLEDDPSLIPDEIVPRELYVPEEDEFDEDFLPEGEGDVMPTEEDPSEIPTGPAPEQPLETSEPTPAPEAAPTGETA